MIVSIALKFNNDHRKSLGLTSTNRGFLRIAVFYTGNIYNYLYVIYNTKTTDFWLILLLFVKSPQVMFSLC